MGAGLLDPEFLIGASLSDDRFKIVARVGTGSMAIVYRAFDHRLETEVVVKVPRKHKLQDVGLRERFRRETRLLVQLQHPHIVGILDVGLHGNVPYVVMQYLSGGCLLDRLQARNGQPTALSVDSIRTWLLEVAKALDFAHKQKVIHRDVKPANILFDEAGNAFLGDFGLTKIMYGEPEENAVDETAAGFVVGTPNYVAPEIVLGADYDGRADQYSLGLTVFHTLVGSPPMLGKTPSATMVNQTRRVLPLISDIRKAVPVPTAIALARAISKNPEERFATCVEFAEAAIAGLTGSSEKLPRPPATADSSVRSQADSTTVRGTRKTPATNAASLAPLKKSGVAGSVSRAKSIGVIDCPRCQNEVRLRPEHAGRWGRCVKCATRLQIAPDLSTLTVLPERIRSESKSSSSSASNSADDLIIGEKVFGMKLGRKSMYVLAIALVLALLAATVIFALQLTKEDPNTKSMNDFRSTE